MRKARQCEVDVYDPSFFVAFGFATEAPVKLSGNAVKGCTAEIKKPDPKSEEDAKALQRSLFQSVGTEQQFWLAVRADGDSQMQRRPVLAHTARALLSVLGALILVVLAASAESEMKPIDPLAAESPPVSPPSAFAAPSTGQQSPGAFSGIFGWVLRTQQSLQRDLATGVKSLKGDHAMTGAMMLAALSFIYGVVHAVGPGHGKTIISSYVVANEETVRRGVIISFIAAGLQALTAIALVGILAFALNASGMQINAWSNQLEMVSYALIALVGAWLLTTQLIAIFRRWRESRAAEAQAGHDHQHRSSEHDHYHHGHDHNDPDAHDHQHGHSHAEGEACHHIVDARELAGPFSWRKFLQWCFRSASGRARGRFWCSSSR